MAAQWSTCGSCFFCPLQADRSPVLLVSSVTNLVSRIASLLNILPAFASCAEAICKSCLRSLDELEHAITLREAMRNHFEAYHGNEIERELGFAYVMPNNAAPEMGDQQAPCTKVADIAAHRRKCSRPASLCSRTAAANSRPRSRLADAADEASRSRASSCDDGSLTSNGREQDEGGRTPKKSERKRYRCPECSKVFAAKSHYDDHVMTHSDTRQFTCGLCGKAFKFKRGLREHLRTMHDGIGLDSLNGGDGSVSAADAGTFLLLADDSTDPIDVVGLSVDAESVREGSPANKERATCSDGYVRPGGSPPPPVLLDSGAAAPTKLAADADCGARDAANSVSTGNGRRSYDDAPPALDDECKRQVEYDSDNEDERGQPAKKRSKVASQHAHGAALTASRKPKCAEQRATAEGDSLVDDAGTDDGCAPGSGSVTPGAGAFPCALCPSRFKYKRGLVSHLKRKHLESSNLEESKTASAMLEQLGNPRILAAAMKRLGLAGAAAASRKSGVAEAASKRREEASDDDGEPKPAGSAATKKTEAGSNLLLVKKAVAELKEHRQERLSSSKRRTGREGAGGGVAEGNSSSDRYSPASDKAKPEEAAGMLSNTKRSCPSGDGVVTTGRA